MKKELSKITKDLKQGTITETEAQTLLLGLLGVSKRRELLLDFLYWRESEIHPADANKIVDNFFEQKKSNNSC